MQTVTCGPRNESGNRGREAQSASESQGVSGTSFSSCSDPRRPGSHGKA